MLAYFAALCTESVRLLTFFKVWKVQKSHLLMEANCLEKIVAPLNIPGCPPYQSHLTVILLSPSQSARTVTSVFDRNFIIAVTGRCLEAAA